MDKDRAHKLVSAEGVSVPQSFALNRSGGMETAHREAERIGYPLFVKPVRAGSSFGISRVTERSALDGAVRLAFQYDDTVLLEQAIDGFEIGCAVMGGETLTVGELDEVELSGGFFDYTEKYSLKTSLCMFLQGSLVKRAIKSKTRQRLSTACSAAADSHVWTFFARRRAKSYSTRSTRFPALHPTAGFQT
jgi:D-alanine--D-alanine ligase